MPEGGRFDGDLYAQLVHVPHAGRKQYRVRVWSWVEYVDPELSGWRNAMRGTWADSFDHEKWFKTAWDAALYLGKVRGWAEARVIALARRDALIEQEVRLA